MVAFAITDNLDWSVEQRPIYFPSAEGELIRYDDKVAIVRSDNGMPLGVVSEGYETVQNSELMSMVAPMVEEGLLSIENIGYLNGGAKVFIQAQIAQEFKVLGEEYKAYATLLNGHVGNASVAIGSSNVRVICNNTFSMAYRQVQQKFRHSEGVNERVLESKTIIDYVNRSMVAYAESAEKLALTPCSKTDFQKLMEIAQQKEITKMRESFVEEMERNFTAGVGTEGRTYYDAINAITYYNSHQSRKTEDGCFNYVNFGKGSKVAQRAMAAALELVSA